MFRFQCTTDTDKRKALFGLIVIALASAGVWWGEVQWRGWDGLKWIFYFHFAIPIGTALFLAWLYFHCDIEKRSRQVLYVGTVLASACIAYVIFKFALSRFYSNGQGALGPLANWPISRQLPVTSIYYIFPAMPIVFWILSRLFGVRFKTAALAIGFAIYLLAVPAGMMTIYLLNHRGYPDSIHAIKTGFCIPFLILGLGVPFVFNKS